MATKTKEKVTVHEQIDVISALLTAMNRPMTSAEIREHPTFSAVYRSPKSLGAALAVMKRRGLLKKEGSGTRYAKYTLISHSQAKGMKIADMLKTLRMTISKSSRSVSFELDGIRLEITVVD